MNLEIELVPSSVWESSLYRLLPKKEWNRIRDDIISEKGRKCQICGEIEGVMNLHEIWSYNDEKYLQKLEGFLLLCRMCHHIKHLGLAGILSKQGKLNYDKIIEHFCKVNNCSKKDFKRHKAKAFKIWENRSKHQWTQDFGRYKELIDK